MHELELPKNWPSVKSFKSRKNKFWEGEFFSTNNFLSIHWRLSIILKTTNKSVWRNAFWYVEVCIFWKCIQYTIHWDKTQILKKILSDKINGTKNALFFPSRDPTHHSFALNFRFLYELKHKICLSKSVCGIFQFQFRFVFIKVYNFVQQNTWTLWLDSFQN